MNIRPSVFAAAVLVLGASACIGNNESLVALGIGEPDAMCLVSGTTTTFNSGVTVDLSVARSVSSNIILRNNMIPNQQTIPPQAEARTVLIEGVNVKFRTGTISKLSERYTPSSGSVEPGQGKAPVTYELLSARDVDILRGDRTLANLTGTATIIANVKVQGRMTDGGQITSTEVAIPIRICRGCLQSPLPPGSCCAHRDDDPNPSPAPCVGMDRPVEPTSVCNFGRDDNIDFCSYSKGRR